MFLKFIPTERPVLLLVDGHKAHVTQDVIEVAVENKILVYCLPAHASHLLQPLDLSLFGPLKKGWVKACAAFHHLTSVVVNQRNFSKIFNVAWHSSNTPDVIMGGFRRSGIYPFDPNKFDYGKLAPSQPSATGTPSAPPVTAPVSTGTPSSPQLTVLAQTSTPMTSAPSVNVLPSTPILMPADLNHQAPLSPFSTPPAFTPPHEGNPVLCHDVSPTLPAASFPCISPSMYANEFAELEEQIGRQQRERFRRRYENGFDVQSDGLYNRWKMLRETLDGQVMESGGICPCNGACNCSCRGVGFCECVGSLGCSLPLPLGPGSLPNTSTSTTVAPGQSLEGVATHYSPPGPPKEYMISTPTGDVVIDQDLCSIMLKPATVSRGGGKRRRLSLDPGNKCITGDIFLTAVRTENERKEKEKEEKERKKQERARLAEEKKKKAEEKKKKIQERKEANKKKERKSN